MSIGLLGRIKRHVFPERNAIFAAAQTQNLTEEEARKAPYSSGWDETKASSINITAKSEPSDTSSLRNPNAFDKITTFAGSSVTFFVMLSFVGLWALWGVMHGATDTWQIVFQNASSIQVYIMDILLIRQQQNASRTLTARLAEFHSRHTTFERLLTQIPGCDKASIRKEGLRTLMIGGIPFNKTTDESSYIPAEKTTRISYAWAQICQIMARGLGSLYTFLLYWVGIGVWMAMGPSLRFSDTWQLYINTATALALTFTSVFLQNIQQREEDKLTRCLQHTLKIDAQIEKRLRLLTGDLKPNPLYTIAEPERSWSERANDFMADVMGSGLGVLISLTFVVIWVSIGPVLKFNDNWWLIIGSFTGLVGFVDGFLLRSLYLREENFLKTRFHEMALADEQLLDQLNLAVSTPDEPQRSITATISLAISNACGHRFAPLGGVGVVVGLLIVATGMMWSMTGQLLCNTPTMIIEGFLLVVLIHAHNYANMERDTDYRSLLKRRLLLLGFVGTLE